MTALKAIRQLVLGETWTLPLGLLAVLLAGVALRAAVPEVWREVGGLILVVGVVLTLTASIRLGARRTVQSAAPGRAHERRAP